MKITNPTDDQLNAAFAEMVAGWKFTKSDDENTPQWYTGTDCLSRGSGFAFRVPLYCSDANAVLPWLEKWHTEAGYLLTFGEWLVLIRKNAASKEYWREQDKSLPRACVIALLRAHGVEIEITR